MNCAKQALEAAALGAGDRPVEDSDARAIESAERRATGVAMPMKGGIGATAQSAAQLNHGVDKDEQTTLADVLMVRVHSNLNHIFVVAIVALI